ncbi:hypothetical protein CYY_002491 [Polysphondylium violaceum]|uniref:Conserved oligomeric Golgi complex subunit 5 n=1 Tax=Polysphondylium violaceum TaxID=133409 RepID=A0A8J4PYB7_9MYCE|nr:hypothetical protein CYY_002491 [Polysphondylium violaceum]
MNIDQDDTSSSLELKSVNAFDGNNSFIYNQFLGDDFNVTAYTSDALKVASLTSSLETLTTCTKELDQELHDTITTNYKDLFKQASHLKELDTLTDTLKLGVQNLEDSIQRMKDDISEPYNKVKTQIDQLKRVQDSCELLRKVIRYLSLVKKLKSHLSTGSRDLSKAAQCISEINLLKKVNDLSGIDIIDSQNIWIKTCTDQIITISTTLIHQGIENQNQNEVVNSLQVFYNMGILNDKVNSIVHLTTEKVVKNIKVLLNVNKLLVADFPKLTTPSSSSTNVSSSASTNNDNRFIWSKIETLMDTLYSTTIQILYLQRLLSKIKDPVTHKSLFEIYLMNQSNSNNSTSTSTTNNDNSISNVFWKTIVKSLENNFIVAAKSSNIVENIFVHEYPVLSKYYLEFLKRLQNHLDLHLIISLSKQITNGGNSSGGGNSSTNSNQNELDYKSTLFKTISVFEKGYLEYIASKLIGLTNSLFPQSSSSWTRITSNQQQQHTKQLIDLSKLIWSLIESLASDKMLTNKLVKVIERVLDIYASKVASLIQHGNGSQEILLDQNITSSQNVNIMLFNTSIQLYNSMQSLISSQSLDKESVAVLEKSLSTISAHCTAIIQPLFTFFLNSIEQIISTMHSEDWNKQSQQQPQHLTAGSKYIDAIKLYINHFNNQFLIKFTPCHLLSIQIRTLVTRVFTVFLRNCSMLKQPMSENAKLKLANDITLLEFSITPLLSEGIKEVGEAYSWLRSFKQSLFKDK